MFRCNGNLCLFNDSHAVYICWIFFLYFCHAATVWIVISISRLGRLIAKESIALSRLCSNHCPGRWWWFKHLAATEALNNCFALIWALIHWSHLHYGVDVHFASLGSTPWSTKLMQVCVLKCWCGFQTPVAAFISLGRFIRATLITFDIFQPGSRAGAGKSISRTLLFSSPMCLSLSLLEHFLTLLWDGRSGSGSRQGKKLLRYAKS